MEEAGCGAIGLHCAHAYMMPGAFLSPLRNKRMDEYGGCIDNRARYILEVIAEVRANVSPDFPIFLRVSGSERGRGRQQPRGDALPRAQVLRRPASTSSRSPAAPSTRGLENIIPSHGKHIGMNVYEASEIKKVVNIPVYAVGKINDIRYGRRHSRARPRGRREHGPPPARRPRPLQQGLREPLRRHHPLREAAAAAASPAPRSVPSCRCHINPRVGHEYDYPDNPTDKPKKTLINRRGPRRHVRRRHPPPSAATTSTVWEADDKIGGQLNLAVTSPRQAGDDEVARPPQLPREEGPASSSSSAGRPPSRPSASSL